MSRPRDMPEDQELAAASCFTGEVLQPTFDPTNRWVTIQGTGFHGQPLNSIPVLFPYGHLGMPPQGVELTYLETASGLVVVSARDQLPTGIPVPADGDSIQYSSGGGYAHHDADGDTVVEPPSGQKIKVGAGATDFAALAAKVLTELGKVLTWAKTHTHPANLPVTVDPISHAGFAVGVTAVTTTDFSPASVAAVKAMVE